jgi:RHS repeat-associated protein
MSMPGREYSAAKTYRYGFNGKENDNEVKGEGNQQDYGMRIYDPRLGRFLSKDPLSFKFPFYSPYHFAGNNPIKNLDLDGGEPRDYLDKWVSQTMVGHATSEQSKSLTGHYDPQDRLHLVTVSSVYDNVTKQTWYVHEENNQYYYWKFNEGVTDNVLRYQRGYQNGSWAKFETQEQREARFGGEIADGFGIGLFGLAAAISGGFAISGVVSSVSPTMAMWYGLYAGPAANVVNNYVVPLFDASGQAGNAGAAVESYFASGSIKQTGNWVYGLLNFTGKSGNARVLETGGEMIVNGKTLTINGAAYIQGLSNKEAVGELGRDGIRALEDIYKKFGKENGFEKLIINYERSAGSSSANPGGTVTKEYDLLQ